MNQAGVLAASQPGRAVRRGGAPSNGDAGKGGSRSYIYTNNKMSQLALCRCRKHPSKLPKLANSSYAEVMVCFLLAAHTYTPSDLVVRPRGNSGSAGKASESKEGVAACTLAESEQEIPAMWPIPWLAPP